MTKLNQLKQQVQASINSLTQLAEEIYDYSINNLDQPSRSLPQDLNPDSF
jgi:hypothetical protein